MQVNKNNITPNIPQTALNYTHLLYHHGTIWYICYAAFLVLSNTRVTMKYIILLIIILILYCSMGLNILYESIGAIKYPPFIHLALNTEMDMKYMDVIKGTYHTYA